MPLVAGAEATERGRMTGVYVLALASIGNVIELGYRIGPSDGQLMLL
jgi:hypothetical protein